MNLPLPDKKGKNTPSKEDAKEALGLIKSKESNNDNDDDKKKLAQEEIERAKKIIEFEKAQKELIELKIKKALKKNLKAKEEKEKNKRIIQHLEKGQKIIWKMKETGNKFEGYVDERFLFEIKKGLSVFSLYVKDKKALDKNKKSLLGMKGTSMYIEKLKDKAEKLLLQLA